MISNHVKSNTKHGMSQSFVTTVSDFVLMLWMSSLKNKNILYRNKREREREHSPIVDEGYLVQTNS